MFKNSLLSSRKRVKELVAPRYFQRSSAEIQNAKQVHGFFVKHTPSELAAFFKGMESKKYMGLRAIMEKANDDGHLRIHSDKKIFIII